MVLWSEIYIPTGKHIYIYYRMSQNIYPYKVPPTTVFLFLIAHYELLQVAVYLKLHTRDTNSCLILLSQWYIWFVSAQSVDAPFREALPRSGEIGSYTYSDIWIVFVVFCIIFVLRIVHNVAPFLWIVNSNYSVSLRFPLTFIEHETTKRQNIRRSDYTLNIEKKTHFNQYRYYLNEPYFWSNYQNKATCIKHIFFQLLLYYQWYLYNAWEDVVKTRNKYLYLLSTCSKGIENEIKIC